jgi:hypothetical protein
MGRLATDVLYAVRVLPCFRSRDLHTTRRIKDCFCSSVPNNDIDIREYFESLYTHA